MAIYGLNLLISPRPWNYVCSIGSWVHVPSMFKWWHWVAPGLFMADQICFCNRRRLWYESHSWPFDKNFYNSSGHVRYMAAMAKYCKFLKFFTSSIRRDFLYRNLFLLSFMILWYHIWFCYILTTAVAYFCVVADNDFLNNPHDLFYSRILFMLISLYVPLPWPCTLVASVLKHILGGHKKLSNAEKN